MILFFYRRYVPDFICGDFDSLRDEVKDFFVQKVCTFLAVVFSKKAILIPNFLCWQKITSVIRSVTYLLDNLRNESLICCY